MTLVGNLIQEYLQEDKMTIVVLLFMGIITNIIQTVGFTRITAKVLGHLQNKQFPKAYEMFRYFIYLSLITIGINYVYRIFQNKLLSQLYQWSRFQLVRMLLVANDNEFSNENFSTMIAPINRVSSTTLTTLNDILTYYIPNLIFIGVIVAYILYQHVSIGSLFIIGNLIWIIYLYSNWNTFIQKNKEYEEYMNDTENYLSEIMNNVDKIVSRGQVPNELSIFDNKKNMSSDKAFSFYRYMDNNLFIVNTIVLMTVVACIGAAVRLYVQGKFNHLSFVTFFTILLMYRDRIISTLSVLPEFIDSIGRSDVLLERFEELKGSYKEYETKTYTKHDLPFQNLTLENVCYEVNNKKIFENVNLQIPTRDNSIIGITGPSGKGKSTMCKMFLKMYKCNQGTVTIDGVNIDEIDPMYIRSNIVYINQSAKLFDRKILDNILYGCQDKNTCHGKYKLIMSYPKMKELFQGLDMKNSDSGPSGEKLSGGQRQMVNIISGLINPCRILILDEPTNALDKTLKIELLEIIQKFKDDKQAIILITHDKDVYPLFDKHITI